MGRHLRVPGAKAVNTDLERALHYINEDVQLLRKFSKAHMISRVLWDSCGPARRHRFIAQEYVRVEANRVILTEYGLEVIGYREATA